MKIRVLIPISHAHHWTSFRILMQKLRMSLFSAKASSLHRQVGWIMSSELYWTVL